MPNARLAARILREIIEHPEHYNQAHWVHGADTVPPHNDLGGDGDLTCGTTLCIAGYAAHLTGYTLTGELAAKPGHRKRFIYDVARAELDLTENDATWLFWGGRTPAQAHAALTQLAAGAPTIDQATIHQTHPTAP
ncbi:hypothetical protein [Streptomyces sp. NPDC048192]|uniref:hypothetical protein n=1 Tax=Streptomyces sp. NPDC048192 TaxID=3365510 RepID=UPI0037142AC0